MLAAACAGASTASSLRAHHVPPRHCKPDPIRQAFVGAAEVSWAVTNLATIVVPDPIIGRFSRVFPAGITVFLARQPAILVLDIDILLELSIVLASSHGFAPSCPPSICSREPLSRRPPARIRRCTEAVVSRVAPHTLHKSQCWSTSPLRPEAFVLRDLLMWNNTALLVG